MDQDEGCPGVTKELPVLRDIHRYDIHIYITISNTPAPHYLEGVPAASNAAISLFYGSAYVSSKNITAGLT